MAENTNDSSKEGSWWAKVKKKLLSDSPDVNEMSVNGTGVSARQIRLAPITNAAMDSLASGYQTVYEMYLEGPKIEASLPHPPKNTDWMKERIRAGVNYRALIDPESKRLIPIEMLGPGFVVRNAADSVPCVMQHLAETIGELVKEYPEHPEVSRLAGMWDTAAKEFAAAGIVVEKWRTEKGKTI